MQNGMQRYRKRLLTLSIMLVVVVLLSGVSYAIFTNYVSQTDTNTLAASCIDFDFNGQNELNITNTYPMKDGEALEQTPYTFTIKNKCDNYIEYYVIASVVKTTKSLRTQYVKVSLLGDSDLTSSPLNDLETVSTPQSLSNYDITGNYVLKKGDGIVKDESRTFEFRMWVNGDMPEVWGAASGSLVANRNLQVKISVVGTVKTRPKDDLFVATTINGEASSTFPTSKAYSASVSCTQDDKTVDIGAEMKWTGSKWALSVSNLTSGNTKCTVAFDPPTLTDAILMNNEVKTPITTPGTEVNAHTLDDITQMSTSNVSSDYQKYYVTYGTGWTANGTKFNLTGAAVTSDTYANSYSSLVGKYLVSGNQYSFGSSTAGTMKNTTNLDNVYYVVSATSSSFSYKALGSTKNITEALLASTEDDYGTSYYFRGAVRNNYVEFANKCWRIVRITGDSSVKLVLHNDNTSGASNPCSASNNKDTAAFARYSGSNYVSAFNNDYNTNSSVGFMYGSSTSDNYADTHANQNKSKILTNLETWYKNNLMQYEKKLADVIWCNDKSTANGELGYGFNTTNYSVQYRNSAKTPTLICPNDNNGGKLSKFTVGDTTNGNGNLTYKIGLLTADEIVFSGYANAVDNFSGYLFENANKTWWTLSPYGYYATDIGHAYVSTIASSAFNIDQTVADLGLRPAIALTSTTRISKGTGTSEDPYVIK